MFAREMTTERQVYLCDICGAKMQEIHCKLICPRCGYMRDCSDP
jgi:rubrerythrin